MLKIRQTSLCLDMVYMCMFLYISYTYWAWWTIFKNMDTNCSLFLVWCVFSRLSCKSSNACNIFDVLVGAYFHVVLSSFGVNAGLKCFIVDACSVILSVMTPFGFCYAEDSITRKHWSLFLYIFVFIGSTELENVLNHPTGFYRVGGLPMKRCASAIYFCPYNCQTLTDFKNSFTGILCVYLPLATALNHWVHSRHSRIVCSVHCVHIVYVGISQLFVSLWIPTCVVCCLGLLLLTDVSEVFRKVFVVRQ